jgi:hypothetical protein
MLMMIHANNNIKMMNEKDNSGLLAYLFKILKIFIFVVFGATLLFGIFQSIRLNSLYGFLDGAVFGISGAIIGLPILIFLDILQRIKCYLKYQIFDFRVNQKRTFLFDKNYTSVFSKLYDILKNIDKIFISNKNVENGVIEAFTKRSWKSFGEDIKIELFKSSKNKVVVVLSSKPRFPITMIDYGKNLENVEIIKRDIEKIV